MAVSLKNFDISAKVGDLPHVQSKYVMTRAKKSVSIRVDVRESIACCLFMLYILWFSAAVFWKIERYW